MKILVVGATGMLGGAICERLIEQKHSVRGFVRRSSNRAGWLRDSGVEIAWGDLKEPAGIGHACEGMDAVISTATCILSRQPGDSLRRVDHDGQLSLVRTAARFGVGRFLFVSTPPSRHWRCPFLDCKREVEKAVQCSGMRWTILQPGPFMETAFSRELHWDLDAGKAHVFGSGRSRISYISIQDVAAYASLLMADSRAHDRSFPLPGPETLSQLDAVRQFEEVIGRVLRVSHTPVWLLRIARILMRPIRPDLSSLMTLGLISAGGVEMKDDPVIRDLSVPLTTVRNFAVRMQAVHQ